MKQQRYKWVQMVLNNAACVFDKIWFTPKTHLTYFTHTWTECGDVWYVYAHEVPAEVADQF